MSYLDQFVSALRYYFELNSEEAAPHNFEVCGNISYTGKVLHKFHQWRTLKDS